MKSSASAMTHDPAREDTPRPLHLAVIMDGNGRWATARGLPRTAGHHAGLKAARRLVEAAVRRGSLGTVTLYAFSSDNWERPPREVRALMTLLRRALVTEGRRCVANGVRLSIVGRRDRLPPALRAAVEDAEHATAGGRNLHLRVAIDYSARDAIVRAANAARALEAPLCREEFAELLARVDHDAAPRVADVDLLIRTGGEQRLSDFLLWECAYAELVFMRRMWPDFDERDLDQALADFGRRDRRYGRVHEQEPEEEQAAS
jgi:undecaprenyl diphosphate synthase